MEYAGIALGGPIAGEMVTHHSPLKEVKPKAVVLGVKQRGETYYYVPYFGLQGFWIAESETKGSNPYDDILRILSEFYVNANRAGIKSSGDRPANLQQIRPESGGGNDGGSTE